MKKDGKKDWGHKSYELKVACHAPGNAAKGGRATGRQLWLAPKTGLVSTVGPLVKHLEAEGLSTTDRVKVPPELVNQLHRVKGLQRLKSCRRRNPELLELAKLKLEHNRQVWLTWQSTQN